MDFILVVQGHDCVLCECNLGFKFVFHFWPLSFSNGRTWQKLLESCASRLLLLIFIFSYKPFEFHVGHILLSNSVLVLASCESDMPRGHIDGAECAF